jgi:flagellar biosynthesis/type III secretory pathway M-ring protein FliF/YscJ
MSAKKNLKPTPPEDSRATDSKKSAPSSVSSQREKAEIAALIEKLRDKLSKDPDKMARVITEWVNRPAEKTPSSSTPRGDWGVTRRKAG